MYHEQCPLNGGEFYCVLYKKFHCCNRFTLVTLVKSCYYLLLIRRFKHELATTVSLSSLPLAMMNFGTRSTFQSLVRPIDAGGSDCLKRVYS